MRRLARGRTMICAVCGEATTVDPCHDCGESPYLDRHYELLEVLGAGAAGTTYAARERGCRDVMAIKEMPLLLARDDKARELLHREAQILRQLDHPAIPTYLEDFTVGTGRSRAFYLVQEFIDGHNLATEEGDHRYDVDEVLAILEELLDILVYLHGLSPPVIHRDIKPSNVMRRKDGSLVLIDFGSVRDALMDPDLGGSTVTGTFGYMAPEQMMGEASRASDLYALGALALRLLSRREPHTLLRHDRTLDWEPYVEAPRPVRRLLRDLLRPDPERRSRDTGEVLAEVRRLRERYPAGGIGGDTGHVSRVDPRPNLASTAEAAGDDVARAPEHTRAMALVAAILVATALGGAGAYLMLDTQQPDAILSPPERGTEPVPEPVPEPQPTPAPPPEPAPPPIFIDDEARVEVGSGAYPPRSHEIDAPVSIVVFSDFGCVYCAKLAPALAEVDQAYGDRVAIHFRDFPLDLHRHSLLAHTSARCAHAQGRFWVMHDVLFGHWREQGPAQLVDHAREAGLDVGSFRACLASEDARAEVESDREVGRDLGVYSTPTYFINGIRYSGTKDASGLQDLIDAELRLMERSQEVLGGAS